jgi:hypothetical protein
MWDEFVAEPPFVAKFGENDLRRNSFLSGQQYDKNGNKIFFIEGPAQDTVWFLSILLPLTITCQEKDGKEQGSANMNTSQSWNIM